MSHKIGNITVYDRKEAAKRLLISVSTLDLMITAKKIKVIQRGRYKFIPEHEIDRWAEVSIPSMWPSKQHGKTTRHFAPVKPPARTVPGNKPSEDEPPFEIDKAAS